MCSILTCWCLAGNVYHAINFAHIADKPMYRTNYKISWQSIQSSLKPKISTSWEAVDEKLGYHLRSEFFLHYSHRIPYTNLGEKSNPFFIYCIYLPGKITCFTGRKPMFHCNVCTACEANLMYVPVKNSGVELHIVWKKIYLSLQIVNMYEITKKPLKQVLYLLLDNRSKNNLLTFRQRFAWGTKWPKYRVMCRVLRSQMGPEITKDIWETLNVYTKLYANPSGILWDISLDN